MKINYRIKLASFIVLLSLLSFFSYGNNTHTDKISVGILLEKMRLAVDPENKLSSIKSKVTTGTLYMPLQKIKADITTKFKAPNKYSIKTIINNKTISIQAYNGQYAWKKIQDSKPTKILGRELDSFKLSVGLESIQRNWYALFDKIVITNKNKKINNYLCYQITCYPKKEFKIESPYIFYVDQDSFLLRRMDVTVFSSGVNIFEKIIIDKYKTIDKIMIPIKTRTNILGADVLFAIKNIEFNININNSEFDFPKNGIE